MVKINIVSSQAVLEMSSFSTDIRSISSAPMVSIYTRQKSTVQDRTWHRWAAVSIHPHYGFVCGRHDAAWQPRSRNPQHWSLGCLEATGWTQESLAFLGTAVQLLHVHSAVCRGCTVLLEHKDTLRIAGSSMTSLWRSEAVSKKSVRDITKISCFVTTMKLPHALLIYSTVLLKVCMQLHLSSKVK